MQVVYISNRISRLAATLRHVGWFMPFVGEVVVCVPDEKAAELDTSIEGLNIRVIKESEVLSLQERQNLGLLDHQKRNYLLRNRLVHHPVIEAEFIMSDDDARPLKPLSLTTFKQDGKYRNYYYYELAQWNNCRTEFDYGQHRTYALLNQFNLPTLSYASHMPQIINRDLFLRAYTHFQRYSEKYGVCEWTTYFNYAVNHTRANNENRFHAAEPFTTLCWPEHPLAWELFVPVSRLDFENFTPALYQQNCVFAGINTTASNAHEQIQLNQEKIVRWRTHTILSKHPEQAAGMMKYFNPRTWYNKLRR